MTFARCRDSAVAVVRISPGALGRFRDVGGIETAERRRQCRSARIIVVEGKEMYEMSAAAPVVVDFL